MSYALTPLTITQHLKHKKGRQSATLCIHTVYSLTIEELRRPSSPDKNSHEPVRYTIEYATCHVHSANMRTVQSFPLEELRRPSNPDKNTDTQRKVELRSSKERRTPSRTQSMQMRSTSIAKTRDLIPILASFEITSSKLSKHHRSKSLQKHS